MAWEFGEAPLDQTREAAGRLRRAVGLLLAAEIEDPAVERLLAELDRFEAEMEVGEDPRPRVGPIEGGRVYLDHGRDIGAYNPCFPEYELEVDGPTAHGTVTFPIAYEGPAGFVHGGFVGVLVDCVVQHHHCEIGVTGTTVSMAVDYRRLVPLRRPVAITVERRVEGDRLHSTVQLRDGERLLVEAEVEVVAGDRSALPEVGARRAR